MDHARALLETAREDALNHARVAEKATSEARELRAALEEATEELSGREAKAKGVQEAVKVQHRTGQSGVTLYGSSYNGSSSVGFNILWRVLRGLRVQGGTVPFCSKIFCTTPKYSSICTTLTCSYICTILKYSNI